ncbi:MAG TPA: hypothetical protein ENL23_07430 [Candidatus Acetothermia bacterium]|nr:hypothetical protein [Candidatus Acetothermia bacterium]
MIAGATTAHKHHAGHGEHEAQRTKQKFSVPRLTDTISEWLNPLIDAGFIPERFAEPRPSDEVVLQHPGLQSAQVFPFFLIVRARKPA